MKYTKPDGNIPLLQKHTLARQKHTLFANPNVSRQKHTLAAKNDDRMQNNTFDDFENAITIRKCSIHALAFLGGGLSISGISGMTEINYWN